MVCSGLNTSTDCSTILYRGTEHSFLTSYHYPCQVLRMAYHHCFQMTHNPLSHHQLFRCMLQDLVCTCWQHCEQQWSCRWHICVFLCSQSCQSSTRQHKHWMSSSWSSSIQANVRTVDLQILLRNLSSCNWSPIEHVFFSGTRSIVHFSCHKTLWMVWYWDSLVQ